MKQLKESILDNDFDIGIDFIDVNMYPWITDNDIWHDRYLTQSQYWILICANLLNCRLNKTSVTV